MSITLREQARKKLQDARAIAVKARDEKRGMTADEERRYRALVSEAETLTGQVRTGTRIHEIDGVLDAMAPESQRTAPATPFDDDRRWRDDRAVALRSKDRVIDYLAGRGELTHQNERYSFGEYVRAIVTGDRSRLSDGEARALGASTLTAGGVLTPSPIAADVIDYARAQARVIQAGAITVPMTSGTLDLAKITSPAEPEWLDENEEGSDTNMQFGAVILTAKRLQVLAKVALELIEDAPNASEVIEREFSAAMANEFDRVGLLGTGLTNQPKGIYYWAGVNTRELGSGDGATPTDYDWIVDAVSDIWTAHGEPGAILYSTRTAATLAKLKDQQDQPLTAPEVVRNLMRLPTNQITNAFTVGNSTDCSVAFTGDFRQLALGIRIGFQLEVSRESDDAFKRGQVHIRGRLRGDVGVLRANHFTVTKGIRAA